MSKLFLFLSFSFLCNTPSVKKLIVIFILLFSTVIFSSPSYAEWTWASKNINGITLYVDSERIRKQDGYVYWWSLNDRLKPSTFGHLSTKIYLQGDCNLFRVKYLSFLQYKESMGRGSRDIDFDYTPENPEWEYVSPDSSMEKILKYVC